MESLGALSGIITIFIIIAIILAFLMPFFVLRIRNEIISMNQKITELIKILGGINTKKDQNNVVMNSGKKVRQCWKCGTNNRSEDSNCISCGTALF